MTELTERKIAILRFIATRPLFSPPSIREIKAAVGLGSTNAVAEQLRSMEKSGHLAITPGIARGRHLTTAGLQAIGMAGRCHACGRGP
jgi:SOS-response transcriptional repressor LexA